MIKGVNLKPFDKSVFLPTYVKNIGVYTLVATVYDSYKVVQAQLTIGDSMSAGSMLSQVIFKSYSSYGDKRAEVRTRVSGYEREFIAVKSAMRGAGIEFNPIVPCHFLELLKGLGAYYQAVNSDIQAYEILSQICH